MKRIKPTYPICHICDKPVDVTIGDWLFYCMQAPQGQDKKLRPYRDFDRPPIAYWTHVHNENDDD